jgi:hypothetical protein
LFSSFHQVWADWHLKCWKCIEQASAPAHATPAPSISHLHRRRHKRSLRPLLIWWSICLITAPTWISTQTRTGTRLCWELTSLAVTACLTPSSYMLSPLISGLQRGGASSAALPPSRTAPCITTHICTRLV